MNEILLDFFNRYNALLQEVTLDMKDAVLEDNTVVKDALKEVAKTLVDVIQVIAFETDLLG
jgi:hypothetical protein